MFTPEWKSTPESTASDKAHAIVKSALSLAVHGTVGELFAFLVQSPFQRRLEIWIPQIEMRLRHLASRDGEILERLSASEEFASVLISATQAAARTHDRQKVAMLASAVENTALRIEIETDFKLLFVRFVDELTPSHIALLRVLDADEATAKTLTTYEALRLLYISHVSTSPSPGQFKLLCNDLAARVLVRFSETLEDFGGLATTDAIAAESSGIGDKVVVTDIGRSLLRFVTSGSSSELSNER